MRVARVSWLFAMLLLVAGDLSAQCRVEGRARAQDGTPLAGAVVRIDLPDQRVPLTGTVAVDGTYRIENVKAGIWAHLVVLQEGRLVAETYTLVTQAVEPIDLVAQPTSSRVMGAWDLDPSGGASGSLAGVVRAEHGGPLGAARVTIGDTTMAATTDSAGRYFFGGLRSGVAVELHASAPGFKPAATELIVPDDGKLQANFTLQPADAGAPNATNLSALYLSDDNSQVATRPDQVSGIPSPGRGDVFRALQFIPGVSGTSEASGELFVRGGTPGETLVTLDGFTLYPVARVFGPFSALNTDAIGAVDFSESAAGAADGGRLAGFARLSGQTGAGSRPSGSVDLSRLGTRAVLAMPIGGQVSFFVAARRSLSGSLNDRTLDALAGGGGEPARSRAGLFTGGALPLATTSQFEDVNARLEVNFTGKDRLSIAVYDGSEDANNSRDLPLQRDTSIAIPSLVQVPSDTVQQVSDLQSWTAHGAGATWTRRWSPAASTVFSVGRSRMSTSAARASLLSSASAGADYSFAGGRGGSGAVTDANTVEDTTIRLVNTVGVGFSHALSFGGELSTIDADYALQGEVVANSGATGAASSLVSLFSNRATARVMTAFLQDSWRPFARLTVTPGVRVTRYDLAGTDFVEPRVAMNYQLVPGLHLKGGWSIDHQEANRLTYEDRVQGDREFWVLADGTTIRVPRSRQFSAGWSMDLPGLVVDVQGYYKTLDGLTMLAPRLFPGVPADATTQWLHYGTGTAMGLEVLIQREWSRNTLWTAYTAGRSEYSYPTLEAETFPSSQDQLHELKVADSVRLAGRWWLSAAWVAASGRPYTPAEGTGAVWFPTGLTLSQVTFGAKNSERLPAYHRLDLSTEREFRVGGFKSRVGVTVFNVYNQQNVRQRGFEVTNTTANDLLAMGRAVNAFLRVGF